MFDAGFYIRETGQHVSPALVVVGPNKSDDGKFEKIK